MKVLIAYKTKYGTTAACARFLAERIHAPTELCDLAATRRVDVGSFDVVLIGGSIYGGKIQRQVTSFCDQYRDFLLGRKVGVFLCCLYQGDHAVQQMKTAFPEWLLTHVFDTALPGGELHYDKLTLMDRLLVGALSHPRGDVSLLKTEVLEQMAAEVNALPAAIG